MNYLTNGFLINLGEYNVYINKRKKEKISNHNFYTVDIADVKGKSIKIKGYPSLIPRCMNEYMFNCSPPDRKKVNNEEKEFHELRKIKYILKTGYKNDKGYWIVEDVKDINDNNFKRNKYVGKQFSSLRKLLCQFTPNDSNIIGPLIEDFIRDTYYDKFYDKNQHPLNYYDDIYDCPLNYTTNKMSTRPGSTINTKLTSDQSNTSLYDVDDYQDIFDDVPRYVGPYNSPNSSISSRRSYKTSNYDNLRSMPSTIRSDYYSNEDINTELYPSRRIFKSNKHESIRSYGRYSKKKKLRSKISKH